MKLAVFLVLFDIYYCQNFTIHGYCNSEGSAVKSDSFIEKICCRNYEFIGIECIKCKPGFDSVGGKSKCKPCQNGSYGSKCAETCNCAFDERCDSVEGCVTRYTTLQEISTTTSFEDYDANMQDTTIPQVTNDAGIFISYQRLVIILIPVISVPSIGALFCWWRGRTVSTTDLIQCGGRIEMDVNLEENIEDVENPIVNVYDEIDETLIDNNLRMYDSPQFSYDRDKGMSEKGKTGIDPDADLSVHFIPKTEQIDDLNDGSDKESENSDGYLHAC